MKRVILRPKADRDMDAALLYYASGSLNVARNFLVELKTTFNRIGTMPRAGSLRFAHELALSGLHAYPLRNFPYLLFYFEREDHIDIVRVLHTHRDIFNLLLDLD